MTKFPLICNIFLIMHVCVIFQKQGGLRTPAQGSATELRDSAGKKVRFGEQFEERLQERTRSHLPEVDNWLHEHHEQGKKLEILVNLGPSLSSNSRQRGPCAKEWHSHGFAERWSAAGGHGAAYGKN